MSNGVVSAAGSTVKPGRGSVKRVLLAYLAGGLLVLAGCRTCPIDECHIRKAHYHEGAKYRARPIWKMQYPAIGERIRVNKEGDGKRKKSDHSRPLK